MLLLIEPRRRRDGRHTADYDVETAVGRYREDTVNAEHVVY